MANSNPKRCKPKKPYAGYPLTAHPNGQWCKKIRGRIHFFGVWADPLTALHDYNRKASDLHAGRHPSAAASGEKLSLKQLANSYLQSQEAKATRGIITLQWYEDCLGVARAFTKFIGNRPIDQLRVEDFRRYRTHLYDKYGVNTIDRSMTVVRSIFKFAYETDLIDRPMKYGQEFKKPSAKEKRLSRAKKDREHGKRLFTPDQLKRVIGSAGVPLKAMILLGINGGFGNTDCVELPLTALDLADGVIEFERPKTAVHRLVPLWPETIEALQEVLKNRPEPNDPKHASLVFLTRFGNPWKKERIFIRKDGSQGVRRQQAISFELTKVLTALDMKCNGLSFYALRHTFRTWADEAGDQHAVHKIMGHTLPGMSGVYVEQISIGRLRKVTDSVRAKLYPSVIDSAQGQVKDQARQAW